MNNPKIIIKKNKFYKTFLILQFKKYVITSEKNSEIILFVNSDENLSNEFIENKYNDTTNNLFFDNFIDHIDLTSDDCYIIDPRNYIGKYLYVKSINSDADIIELE